MHSQKLILFMLLFTGSLFAQSLQPDWLLDPSPYKAEINLNDSSINLSNGLVRRSFRMVKEGAGLATIALDNLMTGESLLRGVKPEAEVSLNGKNWKVGGLVGQPNYAFLKPEWIVQLTADSEAMQYVGMMQGEPIAPFAWKQVRHHAPNVQWPPKGKHLRLDFKPVDEADNPDVRVSVHYELYDGIPVFAKWITVENTGDEAVLVNDFSNEIIAAVEYGSIVDARGYNVPHPNIHAETDFAFSSMDPTDANHHAVHWEPDPDYHSQVSYAKVTPCLLKTGPEIGPHQTLASGESFVSFRTFVMPHDSYNRERQGLAQRRMYRTLAPWTTENPLMMHARFADWERVKIAIDQAAEVGFEMVILTFGSGFNIEDDSPEYLAKMTEYAEYARSKGVEIGGYSLLASRSIDAENDVVMPEGQRPTFNNSPCIGSEWGEAYFKKLYQFYEKTGFMLLEHDGSYPGDICLSTAHPGHTGYEDSRWNQFQVISEFYEWCRSKGIYLNIPDYYYMAGGNKCGMGYREVNWSLPREEQVIHTRQNIYDGTWTKLVTMGWMFVPLTEYHGGGEAATIEPLNEHLGHYEQMMRSNLGAGVQACYRGPRLFDTDETKTMVSSTVGWYKAHREVLEGDLIHLRRADGRDLDYWLLVNPNSEEKGALVVFNPLDQAVKKRITVPLYYTGLTNEAQVQPENGEAVSYSLDRQFQIEIEVEVPANSQISYIIQ